MYLNDLNFFFIQIPEIFSTEVIEITKNKHENNRKNIENKYQK